MLKPLQGRLDIWADDKLKVGDEWHPEIKAVLKRSKVAVLLVTMDFLASDYIHDHELIPILNEAENDGMKIAWVAVSVSMYGETPLGRLQCVNDPRKPLAGFLGEKRKRAIWEACQEIKKICDA